MKIEKLGNKKTEDAKVGDVLESEYTDNMYLITKTDEGKYGWVNLTNNKMSSFKYDTVKESVESASDQFILHKEESVKLVIE